MTPLEARIAAMTETARLRLHHAIDLRAAADFRVIHAMSVVNHRGLAQKFRYARARVRAIQQGRVA